MRCMTEELSQECNWLSTRPSPQQDRALSKARGYTARIRVFHKSGLHGRVGGYPDIRPDSGYQHVAFFVDIQDRQNLIWTPRRRPSVTCDDGMLPIQAPVHRL